MSGSSDNSSNNAGSLSSRLSFLFQFASSSDDGNRLAAPVDDGHEDMDDSDFTGWNPSNRTEEEIANTVDKRRRYTQSDRARHYATDRIGGLDSILTSVWNAITFPLERPESCHLRPKKGLIIHGPKGVGKTLLMEALAERCSHYSPKIAAFVCSRYLDISGQAENNLVQLFNTAKHMRPSVIFLEKFERLSGYRSPIVRTLRALMDDLDESGSVFVVAATKHLDKVDPELRKSGRFETEILLGLPNLEARKDILYKLCSNLNVSEIDEIANETSDFNGSDLSALWYDAFKIAHNRTDYKSIEMEDFRQALRAIQSTKQPQPNIIGLAGNADN